MKVFIKEYLANIIPVTFNLKTEEEVITIGEGKPQFTVTIHQMPKKAELLSSTSLALGEAYMKREIEVDKDLYEVLDLFLGHMDKFTTNHLHLRKLLHTSTSKKNQKKEVTSHYDIGNDFYSLWLDKTMSYSCAYFKNEDDSLETAQTNKVDHILRKLQLKENMTLLDIGCGWGFLLIEAARKYHTKGVGITLSEEQYKKCNEEIKKNHLEEYVTVKIMDYRELCESGMTFDRVVSVGMIEHVGRDQYKEFMKNVESVLKPGGLFLLHYISALEEHPGDPWIKKYIFPGGVIPSLREIIALFPEFRFYTLDVESLRNHYNKTLLCWRENYLSHYDEVVAMFGEEFARMWDLYLASCAATFHNGVIDLHQILISKGVNNTLPRVRPV